MKNVKIRVAELYDRILKYIRLTLDEFAPTYKYKIVAYRALIEKIKKQYRLSDYVTLELILNLPNISTKMESHIREIFEMKHQFVANKNIIIEQLLEINGIGKGRAEELYNQGVRSISDLSKKSIFASLPIETRYFLKYPPLRAIPHEEIKKFYKELSAKVLPEKIKHHIVGSYRRKKDFSRDVDLMIVSNDTNILEQIVNKIQKTPGLDFKIYSNGPDKVSGIMITKKIIFKMDIFRTIPKEYPFMLLYSTGSKEFNLKMRANAKRKGLLLNQKGLYENKKIISSHIKTEKQIFEMLNMEYVKPEDR